MAKEEGVHKNFLESKNHLAVPSGTSGLFTPSIRLQHRQTRKYNDDHLVNSTALYDLHDRAILSIRQRAFLTIDFSFFTTFSFSLGGWGSGFGESRSSVSRITTVRRARVRRYYVAALHNSDFLYMPLLPKKCFTFVWRIHVPATLLHITLASYMRSLHKAPPVASCN